MLQNYTQEEITDKLNSPNAVMIQFRIFYDAVSYTKTVNYRKE
jgi:hypothetical protein